MNLINTIRGMYIQESPEDKQPASPDEGSMAGGQLEFIKYAAKEINDYIKNGMNFPEWFQNKLSKVQRDIESLHSYIEGEEGKAGMNNEEVESLLDSIEFELNEIYEIELDTVNLTEEQLHEVGPVLTAIGTAARFGRNLMSTGINKLANKVADKTSKYVRKPSETVGQYKQRTTPNFAKPQNRLAEPSTMDKLKQLNKSASKFTDDIKSKFTKEDIDFEKDHDAAVAHHDKRIDHHQDMYGHHLEMSDDYEKKSKKTIMPRKRNMYRRMSGYHHDAAQHHEEAGMRHDDASRAHKSKEKNAHYDSENAHDYSSHADYHSYHLSLTGHPPPKELGTVTKEAFVKEAFDPKEDSPFKSRREAEDYYHDHVRSGGHYHTGADLASKHDEGTDAHHEYHQNKSSEHLEAGANAHHAAQWAQHEGDHAGYKHYSDLQKTHDKIAKEHDDISWGETKSHKEKMAKHNAEFQKTMQKLHDISRKKKDQNESVEINEDHFKLGDGVKCTKSGMVGIVSKVDPEGKGAYYTVKRQDGKEVKYPPSDLVKFDVKESVDLKETGDTVKGKLALVKTANRAILKRDEAIKKYKKEDDPEEREKLRDTAIKNQRAHDRATDRIVKESDANWERAMEKEKEARLSSDDRSKLKKIRAMLAKEKKKDIKEDRYEDEAPRSDCCDAPISDEPYGGHGRCSSCGEMSKLKKDDNDKEQDESCGKPHKMKEEVELEEGRNALRVAKGITNSEKVNQRHLGVGSKGSYHVRQSFGNRDNFKHYAVKVSEREDGKIRITDSNGNKKAFDRADDAIKHGHELMSVMKGVDIKEETFNVVGYKNGKRVSEKEFSNRDAAKRHAAKLGAATKGDATIEYKVMGSYVSKNPFESVEEATQIDELSKDTLKSYQKKADKSAVDSLTSNDPKQKIKYGKRLSGMGKASKKLNKEEIDPEKAGYLSYKFGRKSHQNPHPKDSMDAKKWTLGYQNAKEKEAKKLQDDYMPPKKVSMTSAAIRAMKSKKNPKEKGSLKNEEVIIEANLNKIKKTDIHLALAKTKNSKQAVDALKKKFRLNDRDAKALLSRVMSEQFKQGESND